MPQVWRDLFGNVPWALPRERREPRVSDEIASLLPCVEIRRVE
jgi:hypothetical protein